MTDRLTIDGDAVIEEDEATGDLTVSVTNLNIGPDADFALEYSTDGGGRIYFQNSAAIFFVQDDRVHLSGDTYLNMAGSEIETVGFVDYVPVDVRTLNGNVGMTAYHDGSGANTEGPAHHNGTDWISTVDGSTIS